MGQEGTSSLCNPRWTDIDRAAVDVVQDACTIWDGVQLRSALGVDSSQDVTQLTDRLVELLGDEIIAPLHLTYHRVHSTHTAPQTSTDPGRVEPSCADCVRSSSSSSEQCSCSRWCPLPYCPGRGGGSGCAEEEEEELSCAEFATRAAAATTAHGGATLLYWQWRGLPVPSASAPPSREGGASKRKATALLEEGEQGEQGEEEALPSGLQTFLREILQAATTPPFVDSTRIRQRNVWCVRVSEYRFASPKPNPHGQGVGKSRLR